ncbi:MAG: hypothetical protein JO261_10170, partial [Alphaproteobacteria bacterium]|nr:hypothetical protein [Alphaproteobacteria bacterium]
GGDNFQGVLYKIVPNGASSTYVPLHLFCGTCAEGMNPQSSLFMDGSGNIIATSGSGGLNGRGGAVYRWNGNTMEALYSFCATYPPSCLDGNHSEAGVTSDNAGNLFGTTVYGGHHKVPGTNSPPGVVFELTP